MEATQKPLKLNVKRTMLIGFAFFGILLLWQVYDSWCPTFLSELFAKAMPTLYEGKTYAQWRAINDVSLYGADAVDKAIRMCNSIIEDQQYQSSKENIEAW